MTASDIYEAIADFIAPRHQQSVSNKIQELFADKAIIVWCADDVHAQANQMGIALTESEAREVLGDIEGEHNPSNGVTWDTLEYLIHAMRENGAGRPLTSIEQRSDFGLENPIIAEG